MSWMPTFLNIYNRVFEAGKNSRGKDVTKVTFNLVAWPDGESYMDQEYYMCQMFDLMKDETRKAHG